MSPDPDVMRQAAEALITTTPHAHALGFQVISVERGRGRLAVPWREDLVGDPDTAVIAGGVVTSLLDHACGLATFSAADPLPVSAATLDLRIDYMRPAAPRAGVTVEAHCYKVTRSIAFVRAEAWDVSREDLIATAQAAFMINRAETAKAQP
jgi:uncharacterized protein (TIGR00369 family)